MRKWTKSEDSAYYAVKTAVNNEGMYCSVILRERKQRSLLLAVGVDCNTFVRVRIRY